MDLKDHGARRKVERIGVYSAIGGRASDIGVDGGSGQVRVAVAILGEGMGIDGREAHGRHEEEHERKE